jgi:hypothetical protein
VKAASVPIRASVSAYPFNREGAVSIGVARRVLTSNLAPRIVAIQLVIWSDATTTCF